MADVVQGMQTQDWFRSVGMCSAYFYGSVATTQISEGQIFQFKFLHLWHHNIRAIKMYIHYFTNLKEGRILCRIHLVSGNMSFNHLFINFFYLWFVVSFEDTHDTFMWVGKSHFYFDSKASWDRKAYLSTKPGNSTVACMLGIILGTLLLD